jgi:hypothetical protein
MLVRIFTRPDPKYTWTVNVEFDLFTRLRTGHVCRLTRAHITHTHTYILSHYLSVVEKVQRIKGSFNLSDCIYILTLFWFRCILKPRLTSLLIACGNRSQRNVKLYEYINHILYISAPFRNKSISHYYGYGY